jgi:scyllo-inositol 2-dehydrogenase (NADP+)
VHLIDQAVCLFGQPDWVQADLWSQRAGAVVDDAFELVLAKGPLRILLGASSLAADAGLRYRVNGSRAAFIKSGLDPQEQQLRGGVSAAASQFGVEPAEQWGRLTDGATGRAETIPSERGRWTSFYENMRESIEHGTPVPVSADEVVTVMEIIEAAFESSRAGCRVDLRLGIRDSRFATRDS